MNEPLVLCRGLQKVFFDTAEKLEVLKRIDLDVEPGESIAIIGPSGSGKSTLLSIIGGLDRATGGLIRVGNFNLSSIPERNLNEYRASFVGFVFQFHYLLRDFDAIENVAMPAYMQGMAKGKAFERAENLLRDVGLGDRMHHFPAQLSGGERQRTALARALINRPQLLLADEPTGNLDSANAQIVSDLIFQLAKKNSMTLILVTHDVPLAQAANRRVEIRDGRIRIL